MSLLVTIFVGIVGLWFGLLMLGFVVALLAYHYQAFMRVATRKRPTRTDKSIVWGYIALALIAAVYIYFTLTSRVI